MNNLAPMTALEAVNLMLAGIDESPVNTLENNGVVDAVLAAQQLYAVSRSVQSKGWFWNTERGYTLARQSTDQHVPVPRNTLKVIPAGASRGLAMVLRGRKLYDPVNHTYAFPEEVVVDLVVYLDFEELPEAARQFISMVATRKFQQNRVGSEVLDSFAARAEAMAWSDLLNEEGEVANYNVITDNPSMVEMLYR